MPVERNHPAVAIADAELGLVLARVDIAASPERVFRALTTDEQTRWCGAPDQFTTTAFAIDLRVGGSWQSDGLTAAGAAFRVSGEIVAIDPPHLLAQTLRPPGGTAATTVTYRLTATPTGTRVSVRHTGFVDAAACLEHVTGWERLLGWLERYAAGERSGQVFLCRLLPPRPTFMQDMTADERAMMQAHVAYWRGKHAEGVAIAFGPVADPTGGWGLGLIAARDEAALRAFQAADPAIVAGRGLRYETLPMPRLVI